MTRRNILGPLTSRPYLLIAIATAILLYVVSGHWLTREITRLLVGWNGGILVFIGAALVFMLGADMSCMKRRALAHDDGGRLIFPLTVIAAVASVVALGAELSDAKGQPGGDLRAALAAGTVILSWLFMQVVFAMHYAHVYYLACETDADAHRGGLDFGYGEEEPDYWDFLHFAIVIGATSQTADIVFKSKQMRRIGTLHSLIAFGFNTAILATMINLAANLI
jgi:uncharacterized membrane protein